jgi:hypothetical protein
MLPTGDDDLTIAYFTEKAREVPEPDRDDLLKIGNALAGGKHLATTIFRAKALPFVDWEEVVKSVSPTRLPWIAAFGADFNVKFEPRPPATPATARRPRAARVGKLREPRFSIPGKLKETLGEYLSRIHELDSQTLPVTFASYAKLVDGKLPKRHVRRIVRDVRIAWPVTAALAALAFPPREHRLARHRRPRHPCLLPRPSSHSLTGIRAVVRDHDHEARQRERRDPLLPQAGVAP